MVCADGGEEGVDGFRGGGVMTVVSLPRGLASGGRFDVRWTGGDLRSEVQKCFVLS